MSFTIVYNEGFGFRLEEDDEKVDPLNPKAWKFHGPTIPFEKHLREVIEDKEYAKQLDSCRIWRYQMRTEAKGKKRAYYKVSGVTYIPMRMALCAMFNVAYKILPIPSLATTCGNTLCVAIEHICPKGRFERSTEPFDGEALFEGTPNTKQAAIYLATKDLSVKIAEEGMASIMDKIAKGGKE